MTVEGPTRERSGAVELWRCRPRRSPRGEQLRPGWTRSREAASTSPEAPRILYRRRRTPSPIYQLQLPPARLPNRRRGLPAIFDLEDQIEIPLWTGGSRQVARVAAAGSISGPEPS